MLNQNKFQFDKKGRSVMTKETLEKKQNYTIVPAVNITETAKSYIVSLDMPGALKENIKANIENNTLFISADTVENSLHGVSDVAKQYRREFSLANDIEANTVEARYELGVLTVTLNKKEQFLPKQITIK